jgi:hypothetical protein
MNAISTSDAAHKNTPRISAPFQDIATRKAGYGSDHFLCMQFAINRVLGMWRHGNVRQTRWDSLFAWTTRRTAFAEARGTIIERLHVNA